MKNMPSLATPTSGSCHRETVATPTSGSRHRETVATLFQLLVGDVSSCWTLNSFHGLVPIL
jgi:hypothetical protein